MDKSFYSNGKLLLTGEYAVLDGALSLAIPTKFGQLMTIDEIKNPKIIWKSIDEKNQIWYEAIFSLDLSEITEGEPNSISETLTGILQEAKKMNLNFLNGETGYAVTNKLDFPRNWGLGTSSTLINNIAQWARIDAFQLLKNSFGGSGYDIACAQNDHPILYRLKENLPNIEKSEFDPNFKSSLYFIHLNQKQNSREEIKRYSKQDIDKLALIEKVSTLTNKIAECDNLSEFEKLLNEHETTISNALNQPTIKELYFQDFQGTVKSLGAWGGDFILVTGDKDTPEYFQKKGYQTVIPFNEMIL